MQAPEDFHVGLPLHGQGVLTGLLTYLSRNSSAVRYARMLFSFLMNPCPSSGNTTYSATPPRWRTASTIWSDSTLSTRGSFAPWSTSNGLRMSSAWNNGEMRYSRTESALLGSPSSE